MAFDGTGKIWMNGTLVEWKDATIHVASHVIHYGSGVFEGARCYSTPKGSAFFRLDAHMRRLLRLRARSTGWTTRSTSPAGRDAVLEHDPRERAEGLLHPADVYRGYDTLGVNPLPNPVDAAIMVWEWGAYLGPEALEQGVDVRSARWTRMRAEHVARDGQGTANYANSRSSRWRPCSTATREGIALDVGRPRQRRQRPEHFHRARRGRCTRRRSAVGPPGHHARHAS